VFGPIAGIDVSGGDGEVRRRLGVSQAFICERAKQAHDEHEHNTTSERFQLFHPSPLKNVRKTPVDARRTLA